ncbi:ABC-three component system protein [Pseudomonas fluorescens]|uniref:ABC-three component system protein n=1 Tax=Pseudomonas TaxID=286 RepID=UPI002E1537B7|nr:ABC-three component system protein [Pseudomonas fluorescens]
MSLLCEVQGSCPLCNRSLMVKRNEKSVRVFDVAHIYPLNATPHEQIILKHEVRLSINIDCEENFIALCKECHKIYDTKKTVEEYRQLVEIKKTINKIKILSQTWDKQTLHKDISTVARDIEKLSDIDIKNTSLSFAALKLSEKKDETLGLLNEMKISQYILSFFTPIRDSLKKLEMEEKAKSLFICSQVKSYYTLLLMQGFNQNEIFENMCEWFMTNTGIKDRAKSEVLVSYFIQNCEIFSEC